MKKPSKREGLALRDYLAAHCASGLLACYAKIPNQCFPYSDDIARRSYELADALLAEREKART